MIKVFLQAILSLLLLKSSALFANESSIVIVKTIPGGADIYFDGEKIAKSADGQENVSKINVLYGGSSLKACIDLGEHDKWCSDEFKIEIDEYSDSPLVLILNCSEKLGCVRPSSAIEFRDSAWYVRGADQKATGLYLRNYSNGRLRQMLFPIADGKRELTSLAWDEWGQLLYESAYQGGKRHGRHRSWHMNGQLASNTIWLDDQEQIGSKYWHATGQLSLQTIIEGEAVILRTWYLSGQLEKEDVFKLDTYYENQYGSAFSTTSWYENGNMRERRSAQSNRHEYWYENGNRKEVIVFDYKEKKRFETLWYKNGRKAKEKLSNLGERGHIYETFWSPGGDQLDNKFEFDPILLIE